MKKKFVLKIFSALMAAMMIFSSAYAAPTIGVVTLSMQAKAAKTVKLSKCKITYTKNFIYTSKYIKPAVKVTYGKTVLKAGKHYTVKYSSNRKVGKAKITITAVKNGGYTGTRNVKFKINPQTVTGLKATAVTANTVTLTWNKSPLATGYGVFSYNSKTKEYTRLAISKTNSVTLKRLSPGTVYRFCVRAFTYKADEDKYYRAAYSALVKATTKPSAAPKISITYPDSSSIKLSWNPVAGANGYYIYYYQPEFGYRILFATTTATNYTIKNLDQGSYSFSLAAYKTDGSQTIVGDLSSLSTATIKNGSYKIQKYANMTRTLNYQMSFTTNVSELSGRAFTFAQKSNYVAVKTSIGGTNIRILYEQKSKLSYAVINNKTYLLIASPFNLSDLSGTFQFPSTGLTPTFESIGGKYHTVNSIRGSDGNLRKFYFDGTNLVRITVIAPSATTTFYINEFKSPADQGLFDVDTSSLSPFSLIYSNLFG